MCGIFEYYNYQVARDRATILSFLINGLRRLEYRGYDSSGICIDGTEEGFEAPCNGRHASEEVLRQNGKRLTRSAPCSCKRASLHSNTGASPRLCFPTARYGNFQSHIG